ncbi:MAG: serine/threonine-protein kinase [Acidobacteriota bacterium]
MSGRRIGNYLVLDYLGGGGFGSVFKAEDTSTPGRIVAVKELHRKHTRSTVIKQRFFQEAIAMAKLDHPNLPRLFTFGEDHGSYYLVMEFLSGKLLTDEIQAQGQLPLNQAITIISQVLEALSYAHKNGIIHRDLKPDNIMLIGDSGSPHVKVLDFGIARMVGGENLTMAGEGFGTPVYMSPERISGSLNPDARADIYSLGIILYEMLAGKVPFQSQATDPLIYWSEMRKMHESYELPPLDALGVPQAIERIVKKATAKTADYRYATADDMLNDLRQATGDSEFAIDTRQTAQLALTTNPPEAEVYVDEILRGTSDATGKILIDALNPGLHSVRVLKASYNPYTISVVLEDGNRTDLQVALAANATMVMPQVGEETSPMELKTLIMDTGDEVATAMLTLEGVPAGSQVFVGAKALALAGEDGRATLSLAPGTHDVEVKSPSGEIGKKRITLTNQDTGSNMTVAVPMTQTFGSQAKATNSEKGEAAATMVAGVANVPRAYTAQTAGLQSKKKVAMAAAVVLLLALVAGAYAVFSGLGRETSPINANENLQAQNLTTPSTTEPPAPTGETNSAEKAKDASEPDKAATEKDKRETEKTAKEEPETKDKPAVTPTPPPQEPEKPSEPTGSQTGGTACVFVLVKGASGEPVAGVPVVFSTSAGQQPKRTGPNGGSKVCDLPVGSTVTVLVKGAGMVYNGVVPAGGKLVNATLSAMPMRPGRMQPDPDEPARPDIRKNRPFPRRNRPPQ